MRLYLDMDGVLMNYEGAIQTFGVPRYKDGAHWISRPREEWPPEMVAADVAYVSCMEKPDFWSSIQPMDDAKLLWGYCAGKAPHILTAAPSDRPGETRFALIRDRIAQQKRDSIRHHFDPFFPDNAINICLRHEKADFAAPGDILVDDTPGNCKEWMERGGTAILHTDALSTMKKLHELWYVGV